MTTTDEALIEQIRRARSIPADWARLREGESTMEQIERMRKRQDDQTIALIRKAQADAWEESERATHHWFNDPFAPDMPDNPYRTQEARS